MRAWLLSALVLCLVLPASFSAPAAAQKARITMSASATRVAVGEPFAIEVRADVTGEDVDDIELPDFGKLEVLAQSTSRPMSFSFGFGTGGQRARIQSQIIHGLTLRAREPGSYAIQPAIMTAGGRKYASAALTIQVTGAALPSVPTTRGQADAQDPDGAEHVTPPEGALSGAKYDNDVFLRTVVDKASAYLGEQVTVTVYLYVRGALTQNPTITREPTTEGFWVQDLLPLQRTLAPVRQEINGRGFNVYTLRRYAAFPLRSGKLEIGAPAIEISGGPSLFDLITGPTASVKRVGVAAPVEALALPAHPTQGPVHVGELSLEASVDPAAAKVGDAITLRVTARGTGNLKALQLASPTLPGIDVLAPEIDDKLTNDLNQVGGSRTFRWLLLPRSPGTPSVPPFVVDVFDPASKRFTPVRTKALALSITGQAAPSPVSATPGPAEQPRADVVRFGPVRPTSSLQRARAGLANRPWFWWAVLLGPLTLLGFALGRAAVQRSVARRAARPGGAALRGAEQKLQEARQVAQAGDPARAYGHLLGALRGALQACLGEPVGGFTLSALRTRCLERGLPTDLTDRVIAELGVCEQARFDPSLQASEPIDRHLELARTLVQQLGRHTAKGDA